MNITGMEQFVFLWIIFGALTVVVHIMFAIGIFLDADLMQRRFERKTFVVNHWIWALATLIGGVFVAGIYWIIHHSTLNPQNNFKDKSETEL